MSAEDDKLGPQKGIRSVDDSGDVLRDAAFDSKGLEI